MAEGQTRSMQQVADSTTFDTGGKLGRSSQDFWPELEAGRPAPFDDRIQRAVQTDVLPRVSVGHVRPPEQDRADTSAAQALVDLLLRPGHDAEVSGFVDGVLARGLPVHHVFLGLFQPAARRLGELWLDDICSFVDVTLGMATLQTMLRRLAPLLHGHRRPVDTTRSILLATLPGDQHTFGVGMAAEFFRRAGWTVSTEPWSDPKELAERLRTEKHTLVGFSAGREERLDELAAVIRSVRRANKTNGVGIMVGGPLFVARPEQAVRIGADAVGLDAQHALAQAEAFASRIQR